ncbi:Hypothetical predicted protein [Cloeon dipterum]|uniref:Uncharacterized protein n=1 Tax=Cloeon dipterum TaxID=197152 RepID=A0A8S1CX65_9INSE|nr:Hypothetical predicted protein [Cloeon dipterum]
MRLLTCPKDDSWPLRLPLYFNTTFSLYFLPTARWAKSSSFEQRSRVKQRDNSVFLSKILKSRSETRWTVLLF